MKIREEDLLVKNDNGSFRLEHFVLVTWIFFAVFIGYHLKQEEDHRAVKHNHSQRAPMAEMSKSAGY